VTIAGSSVDSHFVLLTAHCLSRALQEASTMARWANRDEDWSGENWNRSTATSWNNSGYSRQETRDSEYITANATDPARWQHTADATDSARWQRSADWYTGWSAASEPPPWRSEDRGHDVELPDGIAPATTSKGSSGAPHTGAGICSRNI